MKQVWTPLAEMFCSESMKQTTTKAGTQDTHPWLQSESLSSALEGCQCLFPCCHIDVLQFFSQMIVINLIWGNDQFHRQELCGILVQKVNEICTED